MDKLSVLYLSLINKASNKIAMARRESKEEGKLEEKRQIALNMREQGLENEFIAKCLNISIDELNKLLDS